MHLPIHPNMKVKWYLMCAKKDSAPQNVEQLMQHRQVIVVEQFLQRLDICCVVKKKRDPQTELLNPEYFSNTLTYNHERNIVIV